MKENKLQPYRRNLVVNMKSSIILVVLALAAVIAFEEDTFEANDLIEEPHHTIVARNTRRCDVDGCNKFCRKLGHARGVCIGSYCQCRARKRRSIPPVEIPEQKHSIVTRATGCGADSCNRFCRQLGHARGVCIGSYCQCRFQ